MQKIDNYVKFGLSRSGFDQDSYDKYDKKSRLVVKDFLESLGWDVGNNDDYNCHRPDLIAIKDECKMYVEAEIKNKNNWGRIESEGYIQIPARKLEYIPSSFDNKKFIHCMVCSDEKEIYITPRLAFYGLEFAKNNNGCWLVCKQCKQVDADGEIKDRGRDTLICIPYKYLSLYRKENSTWIKIKKSERVPYDYKTCRR